eukprot:1687016-Alexandrium_andersonii.AAC.1
MKLGAKRSGGSRQKRCTASSWGSRQGPAGKVLGLMAQVLPGEALRRGAEARREVLELVAEVLRRKVLGPAAEGPLGEVLGRRAEAQCEE